MHNSYFPNTMSSIYANSSDSYWTERQKKHEKKKLPLLLVASTIVLAIAAVGAILHNKHSIARSHTLTQRRAHDQTNDSHWKQCESRVNSKKFGKNDIFNAMIFKIKIHTLPLVFIKYSSTPLARGPFVLDCNICCFEIALSSFSIALSATSQ